jgi:hypothetical protein
MPILLIMCLWHEPRECLMRQDMLDTHDKI